MHTHHKKTFTVDKVISFYLTLILKDMTLIFSASFLWSFYYFDIDPVTMTLDANLI